MSGNGTYIGLAHQLGISRRMNVISNNVANSNTDGFMAQATRFESAIRDVARSAVPEPDGSGEAAFPVDRATILDNAAGSVRQTGNPLDVAIDGDAFFAVRGEDGGRLYTRNGHLEVGTDNVLRHAPSGQPVLSRNGGELRVPPGTSDLKIARDGTITGADGVVIGRLGAFEMPAPGLMEPRGEVLYQATDAAGAVQPADARIVQGAIEGSNVEPIRQMAKLIEVQRAYGSGKKMMQSMGETTSQTIRTLGRGG
jgi:flagellar basal-body rod protein FlgF